MDTGDFLPCCWDDCDRPGYDLHQARVNEGTAGYPSIVKYVFCSERHKVLWAYGHRHYGKLPTGSRNIT